MDILIDAFRLALSLVVSSHIYKARRMLDFWSVCRMQLMDWLFVILGPCGDGVAFNSYVDGWPREKLNVALHDVANVDRREYVLRKQKHLLLEQRSVLAQSQFLYVSFQGPQEVCPALAHFSHDLDTLNNMFSCRD